MEQMQINRKKMALNEVKNEKPKVGKDMVINWVKDDMQKIQAIAYMILQEPKIIECIAEIFYNKMVEKSDVNQVLEAINEQKEQPKND